MPVADERDTRVYDAYLGDLGIWQPTDILSMMQGPLVQPRQNCTRVCLSYLVTFVIAFVDHNML